MEGFELGWHSRPATTAARELVVIEVKLEPGGGHDFHRHPNQEEVIYVIDGEIEQWVDRRSRTLRGRRLGVHAPPPWCTPHSTCRGRRPGYWAILGPERRRARGTSWRKCTSRRPGASCAPEPPPGSSAEA